MSLLFDLFEPAEKGKALSVYTLLNQNQMIELLNQYDLNELEYFAEISDGIENSNYLIRANRQDFVLTIFEQKSPECLQPFFEFMAMASDKGFPLPAPIPNREGKDLSYFQHDGIKKHFILCKKLSGAHPNIITEQICEELGEAFAKLHALSDENGFSESFSFSDLNFVIPEKNIRSHLSEGKLSIFEEEKTFISELNKQIKNLPSGVCHCDFFPDNALVENTYGQLTMSGFLDWYDARYTAFCYDLAVIAISWCLQEGKEKHLDSKKEQALLKGYQKIRPFSNEELELWPSFLRAATFTFWISRELYHIEMKQSGKYAQINPKKSPEEFWSLLKNLKG